MNDDYERESKKTGSESADLKKDLNAIWKSTLGQFDEIKNAIVRSGEVGKSKLDATFLARQRDKLLVEFGQLVITAHRDGGLPLSEALAKKATRIEEMDIEIEKAERSVGEFFDRDEDKTEDL